MAKKQQLLFFLTGLATGIVLFAVGVVVYNGQKHDVVENTTISSTPATVNNHDVVKNITVPSTPATVNFPRKININVIDNQTVSVIHGFHIDKGNHRVIQLISFEKNVTLYLEPTDGYLAGDKTPVFKAKSAPLVDGGVKYKRLCSVMQANASFFHDHRNLAALMIKHDENDRPLIHGTIGEMAIRPVPSQLRNSAARRKRDIRDASSSCRGCSNYHEIDYTHDHLVYTINRSVDDKPADDKSSLPKNNQSLSNELPREKVLPEIIFPQILITIDSSLFNIFKRNINDTIEYVLSFWNAVDLRYRAFLAPNIRLSIAAIVLAEDKKATPYIYQNFVELDGYNTSTRKLLFSADTLAQAVELFYNETYYVEKTSFLWMKKLKIEYDAAITMTAHDLCDFVPKCVRSGKYECIDKNSAVPSYCNSLGSAFYTGACSYDPEAKKMESFGIIEDLGNFASIIPAAHEFGHLLGASHSMFNKHECPPSDGYIMSFHLDISDRVFKWSNCSVYSIKSFLLEEDRAKCLFNLPVIGTQLPRILPGEVFGRDELCKRIAGTTACNGTLYEENCVELYCLSEGGFCETDKKIAVPEGMSCGAGRHCINARCISKLEDTVKLEIGTVPTFLDSSEELSEERHWIR